MAWSESLPSGKYRGVYRLPNGKKRSAGTFLSEREALNAAAAEESNASKPTWKDPERARQTWGEWWPVWWETRNVEPSTLRNDTSRMNGRIIPKWADTPLCDITRHDVKEWATELRNDGLAHATVQRCISLFSASLAGAVDAEILPANPAARLKLPAPSNQKEIYLSRQEAGQILEQLHGADKALAALLFGTGMRWGEAVGFHVQQYDRKQRMYRVGKIWDDAAQAVKEYPKGRRKRTVPVPDWVDELLTPLLQGKRSGLIFEARTGIAFDYHNWRNRVWSPATREAGISVNIHSVRHTYASWLLQDGVSLAEVGKMLGHVSPMTTQRYAHLVDEPSETVLAALSDPRIFESGSKRGANVGQDTVSDRSNVLSLASYKGKRNTR